MARPSGTTRAKKPILKKEFKRLLNALNHNKSIKSTTKTKLKSAFILLYLTGCRVSEIISFRTTDLEEIILNNEHSLSNSTKTSSARLITFDSDGVQASMIKAIIPDTEIYMFHKNNSTQAMSVSGLTYLMNRFIHKILGKLYSTHSFRAGYITTAHQKGFSLEHIRQDIGHESINTTALYATVTNKEIAEGKNLIDW